MIFLIAVVLAALFFGQDRIKSAVIGELNKRLQAEVRVDPADIDITFLSTFPQCALEFKEVLMLEATKKKDRDTLLYASRILLRFNLADAWHGKYRIRGLTIDDASLRAVTDKDGNTNYRFWKPGDGNTADSTRFMLENVKLRRLRFVYLDASLDLRTVGVIRSVNLSGDFSSDRYSVKCDAVTQIDTLYASGVLYLRNKQLSTETRMNVDGNRFSFSESSVRLNDLVFRLNGSFATGNSGLTDLSVAYDAHDLNIRSLLSLLPEQYRPLASDYSSTGQLYTEGRIRLADSRWSCTGLFGARNAEVTYLPGGTTMKELDLEGAFETGEAGRIELRSLSAKVAGGSIRGALKLSDFRDPRLVCELRADGDLQQLHGFFPIDTLKELRGNVHLDLAVAGRIAAMKKDRFAAETELRADCSVSDFYARFLGDDKGYAVKRCQLRAREGEVTVKGLELERGASEVVINGRLPGFVGYVLGQEEILRIHGSLTARQLHVEDFMPASEGRGVPGEEPIIPGGLYLEMSSSIDQLGFGKFKAERVSGILEIRDRRLMVSDLSLNTMQGKAFINALADNSAGNLKVSVESNLERINVKDLFAQMNNFGQTTLRDAHIGGIATATVSFSGKWNNRLESDLNSIKAGCDAVIDRGELKGFSPLLRLGKFVDVEELENISFSRLHASVGISDQRITIRETSVKNSAINLEFWGSHTFGHMVDYHFRLLMSDLFAAKHRSLANSEFGEIAKDHENRRSVHVVMTGPLDDPKIRYDRQGLKQKIKGDIAAEKQNMKSLLKEEFGLFRNKDVAPAVPEKAPEFRLETQAAQPQKKKELLLKRKEVDDF